MQIVLDRLSLHRDGRCVLDNVSWRIGPGERWLVLGASGAGKTQLLKAVAGDVWPDVTAHPSRRYRLRGEWHGEPAEARELIAWLGPERQDRHERYGWNHPAIDVVGTGLHRSDIPLQKLAAKDLATCRLLLRRAGILRLAARPFLTLSYGERRLVLLARALAWRAELLLLDEVVTGLDPINRERAFRLLQGRQLRDAAWICSAHRREDVPPGATHLLWLDAGRIRHAGEWTRARLRAALAAAQDDAARASCAKPTGKRGKSRRPRSTPARKPPLVVQLSNADVFIDGQQVLRGIDLRVARGECWVLHGANGSGKSTLLRAIHGEHAVAVGGGIRRAGAAPGVALDTFRSRTGLVAPHLQSDYPRHTMVLDTVVSGLHASLGLNLRSTPTERRRALEALRALGMEAYATRPLAGLSYGQVRRVLFARALVIRPRLLLLDEAFTGLNATLRGALLGWVERQVAAGVTVVMATHYRREWPRNASHELMLSRGRAVYAGKVRQ